MNHLAQSFQNFSIFLNGSIFLIKFSIKFMEYKDLQSCCALNIHDYIQYKAQLQQIFLDYLDDDDSNDDLLKQEIDEIINHNRNNDLLEFLHLIAIISNNHHRSPSFFEKIEKILLLYKKHIKTNFEESTIFHIFKDCKKILLFLFNEEFISINIRQLIVILGKSKSSINGALVKMGFVTIPTKGENQELLYNAMPYFKGRYFEMRNWTIRKRKRTDEPTQEDNKKVDDEIPFINFYDQPNEEIKFDDVNFTMPEFLFTDFDFSNTSYDYTIITQNSGDFIIPPLMKKENKKEMSESFIYKTDDTFDPSFVIDFNEMGCGLINTIFHPLITQLLYQMYLMLIILNLNVPHLLFVNSM